MISNYYTFLFLVSGLNSSIKGKQIRAIYSQEADELSVAFDSDAAQLVFLCRPEGSTVYLHHGRSRARRNSVDLIAECTGARVDAVRMSPSDRVMQFALDNGTTLAAILYGPGANVLLIGDSGTILDSFKNPRALRGSTIHFGTDGFTNDFHAFRTECASSGSRTLVSVIRKSFPAFGGTLALESAARAGFEASRTTADMHPADVRAIETAIRSVLTDLAIPTPRVYISRDGEPEYFSLIPLTLARDTKEELFTDVSNAIRFFTATRGSRTQQDKERDAVMRPLRQQLEKGKRALRAIEADARKAERAGIYEQFGKAVMAGLPALRKGLTKFDAEIEGETVSIPLEPFLSPVQNAQRYFEKAKRAKAAGEESSRREKHLSTRIGRLEKLLTELEQLPPGEGGSKFFTEHASRFAEVGLGPADRERERLPFRVFTVDGGFEVWAGKNGANNDLLTLRHAKPDDLWFHARGGSGSHVVLKIHSGKGNPGKRACEQAAGIAAYYSKMKNAGTVAVAMTERRYVRKPRASPPGTVTIEREKVIFAKPALPREGEE
ncbi:MAG TPA: NFACT RNA binding domain-containing protein [Bacteroidota bacterium]|nr:NFACT RNA binding domain-containing protein [Bacteroidota bacterium]